MMLRSRGSRPGRFQRSPWTTRSAYFSRTGATLRTSSADGMGLDPVMAVVCSTWLGAEVIRQSEAIVATIIFIGSSLRSGEQPRGDWGGAQHDQGAGEEHRV